MSSSADLSMEYGRAYFMLTEELSVTEEAREDVLVLKSALEGEEKYLYPYRNLADVDFNTFHEYEPCVMRAYAERLISGELAEKNSYANTVLTALTKVTPLSDTLVPNDSLLREFIVGGIYEEFY